MVETTNFEEVIKRVAASKDLHKDKIVTSDLSEVGTGMDQVLKRVAESKDLHRDPSIGNFSTTDMKDIFKRAQEAPGTDAPDKPLHMVSTSMDQVLKRVSEITSGNSNQSSQLRKIKK